MAIACIPTAIMGIEGRMGERERAIEPPRGGYLSPT